MATKITLPAGYRIFEVPGPDGILYADAVVAFDAEPDEVAAALVAAGHIDLMPLLTHKEGRKEVHYSPIGQRVEVAIPKAKAASKAKAKNKTK